nr:MAG TPA: hypothetical protein [Caudoviricetes sp.]
MPYALMVSNAIFNFNTSLRALRLSHRSPLV